MGTAAPENLAAPAAVAVALTFANVVFAAFEVVSAVASLILEVVKGFVVMAVVKGLVVVMRIAGVVKVAALVDVVMMVAALVTTLVVLTFKVTKAEVVASLVTVDSFETVDSFVAVDSFVEVNSLVTGVVVVNFLVVVVSKMTIRKTCEMVMTCFESTIMISTFSTTIVAGGVHFSVPVFVV